MKKENAFKEQQLIQQYNDNEEEHEIQEEEDLNEESPTSPLQATFSRREELLQQFESSGRRDRKKKIEN